MNSSVQIGKYLAQLREKAGLKQNELAKKVTWSPPVLSRVETGEREVSQDELDSIVRAIGTEDALRFAETLNRDWEYLLEPNPGHPDEKILWEAESALKRIVDLSARPDIRNVFVKRLDEYQSSLRRAANLTLRTEYTVAFIGDIGVGKSTAICRAADLEVQEAKKLEPVLEVGGGGVTICEVHLVQGPHYGILVEPISESELRREVSEFAQYLMRPLQSSEEDGTGDLETHGTSREIERAVRNMSGLRSVRERGNNGRRHSVDHARTLAQEFLSGDRDADSLTVEILSRINLPQRTRRELWYSEMSSKPPLRWLKDVFLDVNNGRHAEFSLPRRIDVMIPSPILAEGSLSIRFVDTKGIDGTAEREDLEYHFNDANTVAVLCSTFNDAPSPSVQQLLERAVDGQFPDLQTKAAVLVLPRPEEALAVKTDQGELAEDTEDGYELKGEQAQMILDSRRLFNAGLEFFNVREDDVERLNAFLLKLIRELRGLHLQRLHEVIIQANALVANFEKEQQSATLMEAARRLTVWVEANREISLSDSQLEDSLLKAIGNAHPSSVRASVRRLGEWNNLDYSHQLGYGSRVKASRTIRAKQQDFRSNVKNILDDGEMEEAYGLAQQALRLFDSGVATLLQNSQQLGATIHAGKMQPDSKFWKKSEDRWGQGPGYRDDVRSYHRDWFEKESQRTEERVKDIVQGEWGRILGQLLDILDSE